MTKLSDLERRLPARDLSAGDHFHKCPLWGQAVDWRDCDRLSGMSSRDTGGWISIPKC